MRYQIKQRIMDKGWVIWDTTLQKFIGDGKGGMHQSPTQVHAEDIAQIMCQRVGA